MTPQNPPYEALADMQQLLARIRQDLGEHARLVVPPMPPDAPQAVPPMPPDAPQAVVPRMEQVISAAIAALTGAEPVSLEQFVVTLAELPAPQLLRDEVTRLAREAPAGAPEPPACLPEHVDAIERLLRGLRRPLDVATVAPHLAAIARALRQAARDETVPAERRSTLDFMAGLVVEVESELRRAKPPTADIAQMAASLDEIWRDVAAISRSLPVSGRNALVVALERIARLTNLVRGATAAQRCPAVNPDLHASSDAGAEEERA